MDEKTQKVVLALLAVLGVGTGGTSLVVSRADAEKATALEVRLALLERDLADAQAESELDAEQSTSIRLLWKAAGQNRDAINKRHRLDEDVPFHEWDFGAPEE